MVAEWDRATRSMIGVHFIESVHARGAMIKVLDKPYLDLTTPIGRGFIAFLSAMAEDERHRIVKRANDVAPPHLGAGRTQPSPTAQLHTADRMHSLLVERAGALRDCTEGSPEEAELAALADAIEAYEAVRWPEGRAAGGKGRLTHPM